VSGSAIFADGLLDGQVALITGGGTGLGKAAAKELVACGADVVICGRREEVLEAACAEIGERASYVSGDVRDAESAAAIINTALDRHGRLDTLVNNAGGQYFVPAESIVLKGWRAVTRLNLGGTLTMSLAAHELVMRERGGMIVNVTLSPHHGLPGMTHSSAARAQELAVRADYPSRVRRGARAHLDKEHARECARSGLAVPCMPADNQHSPPNGFAAPAFYCHPVPDQDRRTDAPDIPDSPLRILPRSFCLLQQQMCEQLARPRQTRRPSRAAPP
jgi:hypothetical protein